MTKVVHVEIPAGDSARGQQFWSSLFGWQWQPYEGPVEYNMTQITDEQGAALFPDDDQGIRVYFDVEDINAGVARVRDLGGEADDGQPVPGFGWFAAAKDTEGNKFGLWQHDPSAPAPSQ